MADLGRALISVIVRDGELVNATEAGVRTSWFENEDHAKVFSWIVDYTGRYGEVPTTRALKREFPTYNVLKLTEPYDYYVDGFRRQYQRAIITDGIIDANDAIERNDHELAQAHFSRALMKLGVETARLTDENVAERPPERFRKYLERRKKAGLLTGIGTGFRTLDAITGGYQKQQFVVIGGEPKQGKSFLMLRSAVGAQDMGKKALFLSFEMSGEEQLCRYDAMRCGVNANSLVMGKIGHEEIKKLKFGLKEVEKLHPLIISTDISASTTVSGLAGKIEQHRPEIVFVDGMYLMDSETGASKDSTQHFMSISRGLKRLAQRTNIPIVGTTQALSSKMSHGRVTMHSLGWTSAWSQDADLILGVEKVDVEGSNMVRLRVVAGRNVSSQEINVSTNWEESIIEEMDEEFLSEDDDE